ncbi:MULTISPECIES: DUF3568 family protein [Aliivibrio]|jgi:PBP1b-binding outer membrane lipoprotein LpoB|uniref:DUF3568 domain-containing protein n=2 Tax=Aliivibrio TaxID=511678 RepID=A0A2S7X2M2_9GAMM|nr:MULTISPECIES: DUF3568 family protein [Aliivibrio]OEF11597.1 DUF3568 domain-containing protein [Aliivibrio logei 5S-186]PQJ84461.1 DUF3568 domain-containing protein [Aliivibrio sifiae]GLR77280.1 hypothetical protein GCM10007855_41550 [Aliivibrio sifiae]
MKKIILILLASLSISGCAGVGVATVGAVMYYKSQSHEVASVDIEAPAKNVYQTAIDVVNQNPNVSIINQDDSLKVLDVRQNEKDGSIKVSAINSSLSKLTITSDVTGDEEVNPLSGIFKICEDLNVKCELSK